MLLTPTVHLKTKTNTKTKKQNARPNMYYRVPKKNLLQRNLALANIAAIGEKYSSNILDKSLTNPFWYCI